MSMANLIGAALYKNQGNGDFIPLIDTSLSNTWDVILSGNFSGAFSTIEQVFFYDAGAGLIRIYQIDVNGNLTQPKSYINRPKVWDIIITGSFKGENKKEFLFYNKTSGEYRFMEINPQGDLKQFGYGHWKTKWDVIISFSYGGQYDSLLFYDKQTGDLKLYTTNGQGNLDAPIFSNNVGTNWDIIRTFTPFSTSDNPPDSIFFYDARTGDAKKFMILYPDYYGFDKEYNIQKNCEIIISGFFIGANPNLLLYDRQSGVGKLYTHDSAGNLTETKEYTFPTNLHLITPGKFFDMPMTTPGNISGMPVSDLLLYGIHNKAIYLDWGGYVDTEFQFSEFFDNPHTIMAWFMPQCLYAYPGPIFAENGSGVYMVGQADYDWGNRYSYYDSNGKKIVVAGNPVFFMQIGNKQVIYIVPDFQADIWQHICVVRKTNNKFTLFINGKPQTPISINNSTTPPMLIPVTEIDATTIGSKPSGKLRFGRRTSGNTSSQGGYQAYGFLDDVAVFGKALTGPEIEVICSKRRLSGSEAGLIGFWPFDEPVTNNGAILKSWKPSEYRSSLVPVLSVSSGKSSDNDSYHLQNILAINQQYLTLPFEVGEVWRVMATNNSPRGTHKSTTAFAYDLHLAPPQSSSNKNILCSRTGKAVSYLKAGGVNSQGKERNYVNIKVADGEYVTYKHLADNSLISTISGGSSKLDINGNLYGYFIPEDDAPIIQKGSKIGEIGSGAGHVHIQTLNSFDEVADMNVTIPVAFINYEESSDNGQSWRRVTRGLPMRGKPDESLLIRRY